MLSHQSKILNYEEKERFLLVKGWMKSFHSDNWVRISQFNEMTAAGLNTDWLGISTDEAYELERAADKIE